MLGSRAHALAAWLHVGLGVPMAKVTKILAALGGITVTPGGLHTALHKTAGDADTTYRTLPETLRCSDAVAADETGWRIDGDRGWLWVYVGDAVTISDIAAGRGYEQASQILGEAFPGALERDGWPPYRKFEHATHQTCCAHLLRRPVPTRTTHRLHHQRRARTLNRAALLSPPPPSANSILITTDSGTQHGHPGDSRWTG